jgi:hypothetical protein
VQIVNIREPHRKDETNVTIYEVGAGGLLASRRAASVRRLPFTVARFPSSTTRTSLGKRELAEPLSGSVPYMDRLGPGEEERRPRRATNGRCFGRRSNSGTCS